ncbi:MAG: hypothetical protein GEV08_23830 [Acidimicrobiia bacterium]|nr:hypothetical protein [Acidimicrobiia bacterium]
MIDIIRSYISDGIGLVQYATLFIVGAVVLAASAKTRSVMATASAMVVGALVLGYVYNAEWLGQRVGADIVERENGMPALVGSTVPTVQLGPAMELWLRTASLVLLLSVGAGCLIVLVRVWNLDMRSPARACKRGLIRAGWSSVARSAGLAVTRDKRRVATGTALALLSGPMDQPRKRPAPSRSNAFSPCATARPRRRRPPSSTSAPPSWRLARRHRCPGRPPRRRPRRSPGHLAPREPERGPAGRHPRGRPRPVPAVPRTGERCRCHVDR